VLLKGKSTAIDALHLHGIKTTNIRLKIKITQNTAPYTKFITQNVSK